MEERTDKQARLGDDPHGPPRPGPDPRQGEETERRLGDDPADPPRRGPDPEHAAETEVRTDPERPG